MVGDGPHTFVRTSSNGKELLLFMQDKDNWDFLPRRQELHLLFDKEELWHSNLYEFRIENTILKGGCPKCECHYSKTIHSPTQACNIGGDMSD